MVFCRPVKSSILCSTAFSGFAPLLHCRFKQLPFLRWAVLAWDLLLSKNLLSVSVLNFYARHAAFSKDSKRNDVPIKNIDRPIHVHWKFLIGHI